MVSDSHIIYTTWQLSVLLSVEEALCLLGTDYIVFCSDNKVVLSLTMYTIKYFVGALCKITLQCTILIQSDILCHSSLNAFYLK